MKTMNDATTNDDVLGILPGDVVIRRSNGRDSVYTVLSVASSGRCINERSGAFDQAWALIRCDWGSKGSTMTFSIESDSYTQGEGYPTHDRDGNRIYGVVIHRHRPIGR